MKVVLPVFEGPLDLLLHLIKKNEFDIFDIPISRITSEYLEYLEGMERLNMEVASEFIVMAAKLLQIKAMMLLKEDEEVEEEDPRGELVEMLLSYQAFKEIAEFLLSGNLLYRDVFTRPPMKREKEEEEVFTELSISDLLFVMKDLLSRGRKPVFKEIEVEKVSVIEKVKLIMSLTSRKKTLSFEELIEGASGIIHIVATVLAVLELMRLGLIKAVQLKPFGRIMLYRTEKEFTDELLKEVEDYGGVEEKGANGERGDQEDN